MKQLTLRLAAAIVSLAPCAVNGQTKVNAATTAPPARAEAAVRPANAVELEEGMLPNIRVEPVRVEGSRGVLTATGKVQFNEDRTARVLAPMPGQVQEFRLRVGDAVSKDQSLFSIKSREMAALVTDYLQSQRDLDLAEKTHAMTKDLFEHQAASRIAMQQSENDLAKVKSSVARAEEALRVLGLDPKEAEKTAGLRALVPVLSPIAGTVIERAVTEGQFVAADSTALLTIADLSTVWVLVDVFERDIHLIRVGQKVQVTAAAYPDRRFTASVERIGDKVDPDSRTLKVRLLVSNPDMLLKTEMFITAVVEVGGGGAVITVPAKAVFREGDKSYIFVAAGPRRFERRQVIATPGGDGRMRISGALKSSDSVVAEGALLVNMRLKQQ